MWILVDTEELLDTLAAFTLDLENEQEKDEQKQLVRDTVKKVVSILGEICEEVELY